MAAPSKPEHFDVHASVVFQLGESLISDAIQALLELIKNSYDADASYCKVTIDTDPAAARETHYPKAVGLISIEDDGFGMSYEDIRRGWLTISHSPKRVMKAEKRTTPGGRTPLGDKGLGRLGTQRLGDNLEMFTAQPGVAIQRHVAFSWGDFKGPHSLADVPVMYEELPYKAGPGTRILITGLRDLDLWRTQGAKQIETGLSQLLSPFKEVRKFNVILKVNGTNVELLDVGMQLRDLAWLKYQLTFDGAKLSVKGYAKLLYARPEKGREEKTIFADLIERDQGKRFFAYLAGQKNAKTFSLQRATDPRWFIQFGFSRTLDDFDKLETVGAKIADPGPFTGEVDYFSLGRESMAEQTLFAESSLFKEFVKTLSGVRIYRDGFGVRMPGDWLRLGQQWTRAGSYYGLKPQNTVGYVAISARDNAQLEEKTDREGFTENAYYINFVAILGEFVEWSGRAQEFIRRGYGDFKSARLDMAANVAPATGPEELTASIRAALGQANVYMRSLGVARRKLGDTNTAVSEIATLVATGGSLASADRAHFRDVVDHLQKAVSDAESLTQDVERFLDQLSKLEGAGEALTRRLEKLREEMEQVYELIGIGLTAETLTHEINNIATHLGERSDRMARHLRAERSKDPQMLAFTETVKSSVAAMRRQLLFLAPSLQYVREKREELDMYRYLNEIAKHYIPIFVNEHISLRVQTSPAKSFAVSINKGKLTQIIDNLLLNSEYWLNEDLRLKRIPQGQIFIAFDKPFLRISDNGRGVDPTIEDSIFEPFVSAKGRGKGRGLGLYIAKQLLESEGCSIRLTPERNQFDRRVTFEINLGGVLVGKS